MKVEQTSNSTIYSGNPQSSGNTLIVSCDKDITDREVNVNIINNERIRIKTLNDVFNHIKYTKINIIVYIFACLLIFTMGIENEFLSMNLLDFAIKRQISTATYSVYITTINVIICVGGLIISIFGSSYSRIKRLFISMLLYFVSVISCNLFDDFFPISLLRCFANFSVGTFVLLSMDILVEYLPNKRKDFYLNFAMGFLFIGSFFDLSLFFTFLSEHKEIDEDYLWKSKLVNMINCVPMAISLILIFFVKDSPEFLLISNKKEEAFQLIQEMIHQSSKKGTASGISAERDQCLIQKFELSAEEKENIAKEITDNKKEGSLFLHLFNKKYCLTTLMLLLIHIIMFLSMTACNFLILLTLREFKSQTLHFSEKTQAFLFGAILMPSGLIGGIITQSKLFSLKATSYLSSFFAGVVSLLIFFFPSFFCFEISLFLILNNINMNVLYIYIAEIYEYELKDVAQSYIHNLAFLIGSFGPFIISIIENRVGLYYTYLIVSISAFINFIITLLISKTKEKF